MSYFRNSIFSLSLVTLALATTADAQNARSRPAPAAAPTSNVDVFAFENGAQFVQIPSGLSLSDVNDSPINLTDGSLKSEWGVQANGPSVLVLEMAERTELNRVAFDSEFLGNAENAPRAVTVEVSDISATSGFVTVLSTNLRKAADNQSFAFQPNKLPVGRWVRLTITSNYGAEYTRFTGFRGYGRQLTSDASMPNVTGSFEGASGIGPMNFSQTGNQVSGCYEYQQGRFTGVVNGRVLKLDITETSSDATTQRTVGWFSLSQDGRTLIGISRAPGPAANAPYASFMSAQRTGSRPGRC